MFSNPTSQGQHEIINPSIHEINITQSSAAKDTSTFKIRRRPLPTNTSSDGSAAAGYNEPLLKERPNDNVEEALQEPQQTSPAYKFKQIRKRLGLFSMATLAIGTIVILATLCFLSFLWFGDVKNKIWQIVARKNWMTQAVSLTALAFRTAISTQAVISTSMLAGLALERGSVLTMQLASISAMRNVNNGPFYLAWLTSKALLKMDRPWKQIFLPSILILLFVTTLLCQFTSTALLSDLSLTPILGLPTSTTLSSHFIYNTTDTSRPLHQMTRGSSWLRLPAFYPTFAEYSEPGTNQDPAVVDTGPVLRAFLPLGEQQSRFNIGDYKGVATVLDSRVVCVRPELGNPQVHLDGMLPYGFFRQPRYALVSSVSASTPAHGVVGYWGEFYKAPYGCLVDPLMESDSVWRITLCQIRQSGFGLPSQFKSYPGFASGLAYLVLNVTSGSSSEWEKLTNPTSTERLAPVRNESNGEWLDLVFTDNGKMRISTSLCYAALDTADLFIHAYSDMSHTEPFAEFDTSKSKYRYDKVRRQLGQRNDGSWTHGMFEDRGILQLQPRPSWRAGTHQGDYIRPHKTGGEYMPYISWVNNAARFESLNLISDFDFWPPEVNYTAYLSTENSGVFTDDSLSSGHNFSSIYPDPSFASLLQDILHHGGDIAHGLSSLLTVQAASTYYDQLPQFNGRSETGQASFELVLTPQTYRGYSVVVAVASAHLILLVTILFQFLTGTEISNIGDAWQTLAQIKDPWTEEILDLNTLSSDREVDLWMTRNADAKVADRLSDSMETPSNEDEEHAVQSALQPSDLVGIRLASSGTRTELARRQLSGDSN